MCCVIDDFLDLPSLEVISFGQSSFEECRLAEYESILMNSFRLYYSKFLILDLPKLHTIEYNDIFAFQGRNYDNYQENINGINSFKNTLIMKSSLRDLIRVLIV